MGLLKETIYASRARGDLAVAFYVILGHPDPESSLEALRILKRSGCAFFETAVPVTEDWSEETNSTIKEAHLLACRNGVTADAVLDTFRDFRPNLYILYLMTLRACGPAFWRMCERSVDGLLPEWVPSDFLERRKSIPRQVSLVSSASVEDDRETLRRTTATAEELLYLTIAPTTGGQLFSSERVAKAISHVKQVKDVPVLCGFGIKTSEDVRAIGSIKGCDAVVIGTAGLKALNGGIREFDTLVREVTTAARGLKARISDS